jgi:hypothetical protein
MKSCSAYEMVLQDFYLQKFFFEEIYVLIKKNQAFIKI